MRCYNMQHSISIAVKKKKAGEDVTFSWKADAVRQKILSAGVLNELLQRLMGECRSPLVCLNPSQWALTQCGSPFSFRALRGNPASRWADQLLLTRSSSPLCLSELHCFLREGHAKSHFNELSRQDPLHNKNISIQTISYHYHAIRHEIAERKDQDFFPHFSFRT